MLIHKSHGTGIEARREKRTEEKKKKTIHKSPETRKQIRRETGTEKETKRKTRKKMTKNQEMKGRKTEERRSTGVEKAPDDIEGTTTDALILTMSFLITTTTTNTTTTSPASDTSGMIWMLNIEGRGLLTAIIDVKDHLSTDSRIVEGLRLDTEPPIIDGPVILIIGTTEADATMIEMTEVEMVTDTSERMKFLGFRERTMTCTTLTDGRRRRRRCIDQILTDTLVLLPGTLSTLNFLLYKQKHSRSLLE